MFALAHHHQNKAQTCTSDDVGFSYWSSLQDHRAWQAENPVGDDGHTRPPGGRGGGGGGGEGGGGHFAEVMKRIENLCSWSKHNGDVTRDQERGVPQR